MLQAFAPNKSIQAAVVLLKAHDGRMSRLRLLKMLYMADRQSLQKIGRTITGDSVVAMDNGPVLSRIYNLIKGVDAYVADWSQYIANEGKRDLVLLRDAGVGKLSRFEIATLQGIASHFENTDDWGVADFTHTFGEWIKNKPPEGSRKPIYLDDVLEALGMLAEKETLLSEARGESKADQILDGSFR